MKSELPTLSLSTINASNSKIFTEFQRSLLTKRDVILPKEILLELLKSAIYFRENPTYLELPQFE